MRKPRLLFSMVLILTIGFSLHISLAQNPSEEFEAYKVLSLKNGPNEIDLNGDGIKDLVFVAWRENYNAHGFDLLTFYLNASDLRYEGERKEQWLLIPFFNEKGVQDMTSYSSEMGADCILSDIRILRSKASDRAPVMVVIGAREFGKSYADSASVKFIVFELRHNKEGMSGAPPFYFQKTRIIPGKKKYCDINEAFQKELGLGVSR